MHVSCFKRFDCSQLNLVLELFKQRLCSAHENHSFPPYGSIVTHIFTGVSLSHRSLISATKFNSFVCLFVPEQRFWVKAKVVVVVRCDCCCCYCWYYYYCCCSHTHLNIYFIFVLYIQTHIIFKYGTVMWSYDVHKQFSVTLRECIISTTSLLYKFLLFLLISHFLFAAVKIRIWYIGTYSII